MDFAPITLRQCNFFEPMEIQILLISNPLKHAFPRQSFREVFRLIRTVLITDELETLMWEIGKTNDGAKDIFFETRVNGKPVLSNGRAVIVSSTGGARL
jgi:hypothetical protein